MEIIPCSTKALTRTKIAFCKGNGLWSVTLLRTNFMYLLDEDCYPLSVLPLWYLSVVYGLRIVLNYLLLSNVHVTLALSPLIDAYNSAISLLVHMKNNQNAFHKEFVFYQV